MSDLKTKPNDGDVTAFISGIEDEQKRKDSFELIEIMSAITNSPPKLWGPSIVGFGSFNYQYKSGRSAEWMLTGFSPRKQSLTLYIMSGFKHYDEYLEKLGKHKTGKSCLYVKRLSDIDRNVLEEIIKRSCTALERLSPKDETTK